MKCNPKLTVNVNVNTVYMKCNPKLTVNVNVNTS